jgi:hypothetical protein
MKANTTPVRRGEPDTLPTVSFVNGKLRVEIDGKQFFMTPFAASGLRARIDDKLAALAKLQTL